MSKELDKLLEILHSIDTRLQNKSNKDEKEIELSSYVQQKILKCEELNE